MQSHENMEIYQKAFDIIERYFGTEEEDKDVSWDLDILQDKQIFLLWQIAPTADANQFAFGPGGDSQPPQQGFNF